MDYSRPEVRVLYDQNTEISSPANSINTSFDRTIIHTNEIALNKSDEIRLNNSAEIRLNRPAELQAKPTVHITNNYTKLPPQFTSAIMNVTTMSTPLALAAANSGATFTLVVCLLLVVALVLFVIYKLYDSRTNILSAFKGFGTGWHEDQSIQTSVATVSESVSMVTIPDSSESNVTDGTMSSIDSATNRAPDNGLVEQQHTQQHQQEQGQRVPILVIMRQHRPTTDL